MANLLEVEHFSLRPLRLSSAACALISINALTKFPSGLFLVEHKLKLFGEEADPFLGAIKPFTMNKLFSLGTASMLLFMSALPCLSQDILNNESILKLVTAQMGDDVIVRLISSQTGRYNITPDALISLKQSGASIQVISAIVKSATSISPAKELSSIDETRGHHMSEIVHLDSNATVRNEPTQFHGSMAQITRNQNLQTSVQRERSLRGEGPVLEDGTPIRLRFTAALTSAKAVVGDTAHLSVVEDVRVGDAIVIPKGSTASGTVVSAQHRRMLGFGGNLGVTLDWIELQNGNRIPIRAEKATSDEGRLNGQSDEVLLREPIEWPVTPLIVLKGKDAVIAQGTEVSAYSDGETGFNND